MRNPMVALFRWFDASEESNEHISSLKSVRSCSIFVKLVRYTLGQKFNFCMVVDIGQTKSFSCTLILIWVIFKLPFSHPITEILLPTCVFLLPGTMRLMGLLSLVRFIVTWGYFIPKTHPVYRCSDVITLSTDGVKIYKVHPCVCSKYETSL